MKNRNTCVALFAVATFASGIAAVSSQNSRPLPSAQEIADRRNRVIAESLTHEKEDTATVLKLLSAVSQRDYALLRVDTDPAFQAFEEKKFKAVLADVHGRFGKDFELGFLLGYLRRSEGRVSVWSVSFDDSDDWIATLSVKDGKVVEFSLK